MGADLIGWMAKGPAELHVSPERKQEIAQRLQELVDWARDNLPANYDEAEEFLAQCGQEQLPACVDSMWAASYPEEFLQMLEQLTPEGETDPAKSRDHLLGYIDGLVEAWPPEGCRDVSSAIDPDDSTQVLVFAGEMTWGDEPQGEGFQLLKRLAHSGIGEAVGIRLLAGYVTLSVPIR